MCQGPFERTIFPARIHTNTFLEILNSKKSDLIYAKQHFQKLQTIIYSDTEGLEYCVFGR